MKYFVLPLMLGFGVTIALVIGQRMSTDAMAVVIGVAVGVVASVPTSLLLVALLRKERMEHTTLRQEPSASLRHLQQPNVIVLNPAELLGRNAPSSVPLPPAEWSFDGGVHRLRVVGDEEEWA